jgi:hypothetical protein
MANPATHPREDKRANSTRAFHHLISLKRALVTATDTAPRKSQRPEGRWGKRSGQYGLQAKPMPPQAPYRPYHEPSAMPARSKTPTGAGADSTPLSTPGGQHRYGGRDQDPISSTPREKNPKKGGEQRLSNQRRPTHNNVIAMGMRHQHSETPTRKVTTALWLQLASGNQGTRR